jgi:hypothetical protein
MDPSGWDGTTIKVSSDVRDRLKVQAAAGGLTLGEHLARLAELGDRELRFAALRASIAATSPEEMRSYREETESWDAITDG